MRIKVLKRLNVFKKACASILLVLFFVFAIPAHVGAFAYLDFSDADTSVRDFFADVPKNLKHTASAAISFLRFLSPSTLFVDSTEQRSYADIQVKYWTFSHENDNKELAEQQDVQRGENASDDLTREKGGYSNYYISNYYVNEHEVRWIPAAFIEFRKEFDRKLLDLSKSLQDKIRNLDNSNAELFKYLSLIQKIDKLNNVLLNSPRIRNGSGDFSSITVDNLFAKDVSISGSLKDSTGAVGSPGQILTSTGTAIKWTDPTNVSLGSINQHTDVDIATNPPISGQVLGFDGLSWVPTSVSNLETTTTLVNNGNGSFTYTNEDGTQTTIDIKAEETTTTLSASGSVLAFTDEDGNQTNIDIKNLETLTSLVQNADGTLTYTDESGSQTTVSAKAFVQGANDITVTGDGSQVNPYLISFTEALTSLTKNGNTLSYTDENGNTTNIDLSAYLQNLTLTGTTLGISGANTVDLSPILTWNNIAGIPSDIADGDNQTLTLNNDTLSIIGGNSVDLSIYKDNTDSQTLSISGNNLSISGGNTVTLPDNDTLASLSCANNEIAKWNGSSWICAADDSGTDNQTLSLVGSTLSILNGNSVDLSSINTDSQTLSLSGNIISISNGNSISLTTDNIQEGTNNLYYTQARFDSAFASKTTDNLAEGATNLYYTDQRARNVLSAGGDLTYDPNTGLFSVTTYKTSNFNTDFSSKTTDDLTEGATNLYFTNARADARIAAANLGDLANVDETGKQTGQILSWNGTSWVPVSASSLETTTNIVNTVISGNKIADYTNEDGAIQPIFETATGFTGLQSIGKTIATYENESGNTFDIKETITSLTQNTDGTLTYTDEAGNQTTVSAKTFVQGANDITVTGDGSQANPYTVDFTETHTAFSNLISGNQIATFTNENGNTFNINETITSFSNLLSSGNRIATYAKEDGSTQDILETVTGFTNLLSSGNQIGTYTKEDGTTQSIFETITFLTYDSTNKTLNYTDEAGLGNLINLADLAQNIYNTDGTLIGNRTVTMNNKTLRFNGGRIGINRNAGSFPLEIQSTTVNSPAVATYNSIGNMNATLGSLTNDNGALSVFDRLGNYKAGIKSVGASYIADGLGVGILNPTAKLHVNGSGTTAVILAHATDGVPSLKLTSDNNVPYLQFGSGSIIQDLNNGAMRIRGFGANSYLVFDTDSTERMRIDSNGNVGIGTITPLYRLDVAGTGHFTDSVTLDSTLSVAGLSTLADVTVSDLAANRLVATDANKNLVSNITEANLEASISDVTDIFTNNDIITSANIADEYLKNTGDIATGDYNFDSGTLFIDSINNRIGIGTAAPNYKLDVGTFRIADDGRVGINLHPQSFGSSFSVQAGWSAANAARFIGASNASNSVVTIKGGTAPTAGGNLLEWQNSGGNTLGVIDENGNVGIGINNPGYALDIQSAAADIANFKGSGVARIIIDTSGDNTGFRLRTGGVNRWSNAAYQANTGNIDYVLYNDQTATNSLFIDGDTNNVGINTNSPTDKLHVAGSLRVEGAFKDSANSAGTNGQILTSTGAGTQWADASNIALGSINQHSDVDTTTNAPANGQVLAWDGTNWVPTTNQADNLYTADGSLAGLRTINLNGNNLIFDGSGNIGIGTTNPTNKLQVNGNVRATRFVAAGGTAGSPSFRFSTDADTGFFSPSAGALAFSNNGVESLRVSPSGNVGIGTTTPTDKLTIDYGIIAGNQSVPGISLSANAGANVGYLGLQADLQTSSGQAKGALRMARTAGTAFLGMELESISRDGIRFLTGATSAAEVMRITDNGSVGIGTSNPNRKLHVAYNSGQGWIRVDSDGVNTAGLEINAAGITHKAIQIDQANNLVLRNTAGTHSGGMYFDFENNVYFRAGATTEVLRILNNGNVGIGTTNPTEKLQVAGNIAPTADLTYDLGTTALRWNNLYAGTVNANSINTNLTQGSVVFAGVGGALTEDNNNFFWDNANKRLGIGVSNPQVTLDVSGNTNLAGYLRVGNGANGLGAQISSATGSDRFYVAPSNGSGGFRWDRELTFDPNADAVWVAEGGLYAYGNSDVTLTGGDILTIGNKTSTNIAIDGNEIMARNNGATSTLYLQNDGGDILIHSAGVSGSQVVIKDNGNVGIGTTNPTRKLYVYDPIGVNTGSAYFYQRLTDPTTTSPTGVYAIADNIANVDNSRSVYGVLSYARSNPSSGVNLSGTSVGVYGLSNMMGDGSIASAAGVRGMVYKTGAGTITRGYGLFADCNDSQTCYGLYVSAGDAEVPANQDFGIFVTGEDRNYFSNNVGIGTTSPQDRLHVQGNVRVGSALTLNATNNVASGPDIQIFSQGVLASESNLFINIDSDNNATTEALYIGANSNTSAATNLVTIREDGNVGIGTIGPTQKLDIAGNVRIQGALFDSLNSQGSQGQVLTVNASGNIEWQNPVSCVIGGAKVQGNGTVLNSYGNISGVTRTNTGRYTVNFANALNVNDYYAHVSKVENSGVRDDVNIDISNYGTNSLNVIIHEGDNGSAANTYRDRDFSVTIFDANCTALSQLANSDRRLKTNIQNLDSHNALEKILSLQGVRYNWNTSKYPYRRVAGFDDKPEIGLVAQDVEQVVPEVVDKAGDGYLTLDYGKLIALVVESIKGIWNKLTGIEEKVQEIEMLKKELCQKDPSYSWCDDLGFNQTQSSSSSDDSYTNQDNDNSEDDTSDKDNIKDSGAAKDEEGDAGDVTKNDSSSPNLPNELDVSDTDESNGSQSSDSETNSEQNMSDTDNVDTGAQSPSIETADNSGEQTQIDGQTGQSAIPGEGSDTDNPPTQQEDEALQNQDSDVTDGGDNADSDVHPGALNNPESSNNPDITENYANQAGEPSGQGDDFDPVGELNGEPEGTSDA